MAHIWICMNSSMQDKYSAVWVSHSSMGDFLKCPRLYYLHNVYKDPKTGHKVSIVTPHMSLGVAVHEVLEGLGDYPAPERMSRDLRVLFEKEWQLVSGKKGGFASEEQEQEFKSRGIAMLETVKANPRFLPHKRLKLPKETMNPNFFLNETDNIILNGLIDWIEYLPESDSLHIVDFKTGRREENEASLQLPIYLLLCNALQKRKVTKASYWYLESDKIVEKELPDADAAYRDVLEVALKVKDAREKKIFDCPAGAEGCNNCQPYELILAHDPRAEFVGVGGFNQDMYVVSK
jgi:ATP-dependent helicase/DNAse subunit B